MKRFFTSLSFSKKYIIALSLIALLSILAFFNLSKIIHAQANDGRVINISGKQRMLSQKIALFAATHKLLKLQNVIDEMQKAHHELTSLQMSEDLYAHYYKPPTNIDTKVKVYLDHARKIAQENSKSKESLQYVLAHAEELVDALDKAVYLYQKEAEAKINKLRSNEMYILFFTLLTLVLEAMFIFRPIDLSHKRKTKALNDEKNYSNMVTQTNTNGIIAVNHRFEILTFNTSAERIFGYSAQEMIGTTLLDERIIPKKYLEGHIQGLKTFMQRGELKNKDMVFELEGQRKDKTIFPLRISFGIKVEGEKKLVVANIQDISMEKEQDMMIIQQSRLAAMGEMIGNIAHQWRQPLSSISTLASGAKLRYKNDMLSDEELLGIFDKIKEYTLYLSKTIDDFRGFFSRDESERCFYIESVIKKSVSLIEAAYESHTIELVYDLMEQDVEIRGRENELSQVILNILNNAKDILTTKEQSRKIVFIHTHKEANQCYIDIYDNGGGIDDTIKMKIFEPYFTTKHQSEGTGIGLFMSNKIITEHFHGTLSATNGEFVVDDETYYGAKFIITLQCE